MPTPLRQLFGALAILLWPLLAVGLAHGQSLEKSREDNWEYLFLDAYLDKQYLDTSLEVITADFDTFYLPIEEIATHLELAITLKNNILSGWYINEQNTVDINLNNQQFTIANSQGTLQTTDFIHYDDMLFINHNALQRLMKIEAQIRANVLKINFVSEVPLPRQAKLKRQKDRKLFDMRKGNKLKAQQVEDRYHWLLMPNIDVSSELNWQDKDGQQTQSGSLSLQGVGDLGLHEGAFSLTETRGARKARVSLSKQLTINQRPWHYELGDVQGFGLGFAFGSGTSLERQFGRRRFEGNAQPGWEVELYRNDKLVDYQEVGQNGSYLFENVPVQIGDNHFKLVLYGPQGERREIEQHIVGHQLSQKAGQWTPSFSIAEPSKRLLPLDHQQIDGTKFKAALGYGISDNLEANLAWQQYKNTQQLDARLTGVWQTSVFNLRANYKEQSKTIDLYSEVNTKLFDHDWNLSFAQTHENNGIKSDRWAMGVSGSHALVSEQDAYSLSVDYSDNDWAINANHSANLDSFNFNNRLTISKEIGQEQKTVATNTGISFRYKQHQFRFEADYSFLPEKQLDTFAASYSRKFEHTYLQLRANLRSAEQTTDYSAHLSWQFDHYRLGAKFTIDEHNNKRFGLTFSMAFGAMPNNTHYSSSSLRNTATIKAQAFLDTNDNGIFDNNEQPIAGIGFKGNQKWQGKVTDESGIVYLPEAKTTGGQYVEFKQETLDDPFLAVDETRYNVITHPGGLSELYFPIYETCEVEGEIVLNKNEEQQPKAAVPLLLIDQNGKQVQRILSEYDGFFIFSNVKPGQYRIEVAPEYLKRKGYSFNQFVSVDTSALDDEESLLEIGTLEILQQ